MHKYGLEQLNITVHTKFLYAKNLITKFLAL